MFGDLGSPSSLHAFGYGNGNPLRFSDSEGERSAEAGEMFWRDRLTRLGQAQEIELYRRTMGSTWGAVADYFGAQKLRQVMAVEEYLRNMDAAIARANPGEPVLELPDPGLGRPNYKRIGTDADSETVLLSARWVTLTEYLTEMNNDAAYRDNVAAPQLILDLASVAAGAKGAYKNRSDLRNFDTRRIQPSEQLTPGERWEQERFKSEWVGEQILKAKDGALLPPPRSTVTLEKLARMRGEARWRAGERVAREFYGAGEGERFDTERGERVPDASRDWGGGARLHLEAKTYGLYRVIDGTVVTAKVPLSKQIGLQIEKDVELMRRDPRHRPLWIFLLAPPSPELAQRLNDARIPTVTFSGNGAAQRTRP